MKSVANKDFWDSYNALLKEIQKTANKAYGLFEENPSHPSLHFKKVNDNPLVYSVRISINYRALGVLASDTIVWFWVGNHDAYEATINSL
ncbi:MAG: hypothetical protein NTY88_00515 [Bacteroidetes bacterium]|nr:hypothetical protein [Bacteroidota bacterium]